MHDLAGFLTPEYRQKRTNPREGIETFFKMGDARFMSGESQKRTNPREGIETYSPSSGSRCRRSS